jgi:diphosphomevalonate decarboxylase
MYKKVTGRAPINIALIKYWGKKDEIEVIPFQPSISLSLDVFQTVTTIETHDKDVFVFLLNGEKDDKTSRKVYAFLKHFTDEQTLKGIRVMTKNTGPTAAGLASSASGFAALAITANRFFQTQYSMETLASITRKGSGSAIRSLLPECVMWKTDGSIEQISFPFKDMVLGIVIVNAKEKKMGSTEAMKLSVETSPLYESWVKQSHIDTNLFISALHHQDFKAMGLLAESNALRMHDVSRHAVPSVDYLTETSRHIIDYIQLLRETEGLPIYATMDAGPNVKIMTQKAYQDHIERAFKKINQTLIWSNIDTQGAIILDEIFEN